LQGRPLRQRKDDSDDENSDSDDNDNEETPALNPEGGDGEKPAGSKFKGANQSTLWSTDTVAVETAMAARFAPIRPLTKPIVRKKYTRQQEIMRALAMFSFAVVVVAFQVLCVFDLQCFDVMDNPASLLVWERMIVPVCLLVGGVVIPICLSLCETENLEKLRAGTAMQFVTSIVLSIFGGIAFGMADDEKGLVKRAADLFRENAEAYRQELPYSNEAQVFPPEALFYYNMKIEPQYTQFLNGELDWPGNSEVQDCVNFDEWESTLRSFTWHLFFFNIGTGILFLAQFSISMSYLCHVYYGPNAANQRREV
jgi:hypothetical protein